MFTCKTENKFKISVDSLDNIETSPNITNPLSVGTDDSSVRGFAHPRRTKSMALSDYSESEDETKSEKYKCSSEKSSIHGDISQLSISGSENVFNSTMNELILDSSEPSLKSHGIGGSFDSAPFLTVNNANPLDMNSDDTSSRKIKPVALVDYTISSEDETRWENSTNEKSGVHADVNVSLTTENSGQLRGTYDEIKQEWNLPTAQNESEKIPSELSFSESTAEVPPTSNEYKEPTKLLTPELVRSTDDKELSPNLGKPTVRWDLLAGSGLCAPNSVRKRLEAFEQIVITPKSDIATPRFTKIARVCICFLFFNAWKFILLYFDVG